MKRSKLVIELKGDDSQPLFLRLATSILGEIERGRLLPGDRLPGTRSLALSLNIHRNTVTAAFQELMMQGWLVAEPSRGTVVAYDLPSVKLRSDKEAVVAAAEIPSDEPCNVFHISDGTPDARIMPAAEMARAIRHALLQPPNWRGGGYGESGGARSLRNALAQYLAQERGLATSPSQIMVTRGSQMAIYLAAAALISPGDAVAVEEPGYPYAWEAFRAAGARVIGVPVDALGIDVARLENLAQQEPKLKALYVTPHHQYPTTVTLGASRRLRLLEVARRYGLSIVEDDYDHEYRFDGRPVLPLASRANDSVPVIYIGSLSKLLSPAVRLGYVSARPDILQRMIKRREAIDRQGDLLLESAMAELICNGTLARHARKARRVYEVRRNILVTELKERLGQDIAFNTPSGGLAVWLVVRDGLSANAWAASALRAGIAVSPSSSFVLDTLHTVNGLRIGYANLDEAGIRNFVGALADCRPWR